MIKIKQRRARNRALLGFNDLPIALVGVPLVAFVMPLLFSITIAGG